MNTQIPCKLTQFSKTFFLLCLFVSAQACSSLSGTLDSESAVSGSAQYTGENLDGGAVKEVSIDADTGEAIIDFDDVSSSEEYVLAVYGYSENGSSSSLQLGSVSDNFDEEAGNSKWFGSAVANTDVTEDFHEQLRNEEFELDPALSLVDEQNSARRAATLKGELMVGDTTSFKVLNSLSNTSSYVIRNAVLVYKSKNILAYIDVEDKEAGRLSSAVIANAMKNFEPYRELQEKIFDETAPDVNGDGSVTYFFSSSVNRLTSGSGGFITGFFNAADLFDMPQSNKREIIYMLVPSDGFDNTTPVSTAFVVNNLLTSVPGHEFQHILNFKAHSIDRNGATETSSINEGLSHLIEDLHTLDIETVKDLLADLPDDDSEYYMPSAGIENYSRVSLYLQQPSICFACGASLVQRGGSYLFLRYLYEQAEKGNIENASSGLQLLRNLMQTSNTGPTNIVYATYGSGPVPEHFRDLLGRFSLAVLLTDTGLTSNSILQFDAPIVRGTPDDNRGTQLQGPALVSDATIPIATSIGGSSIAYIKVTGDQIKSANGKLKLNLSSGPVTGAYLVQTGL